MEDFSEKKAFYSKCLAKDIKHEQLLGRQPKKFLIFIVNLILLNFVCLKFSFNCLKFYCVIVLTFQDHEAEISDGFYLEAFFLKLIMQKVLQGGVFIFP